MVGLTPVCSNWGIFYLTDLVLVVAFCVWRSLTYSPRQQATAASATAAHAGFTWTPAGAGADPGPVVLCCLLGKYHTSKITVMWS